MYIISAYSIFDEKGTLIVGGLALLLGLILRYIINRRRFNRRGSGGLQHYSNYEKAVFIRFLEGIGKLLAYILILSGGLLLLVYYF